MAQSLSISLGNFLYKSCFPLYKIMYKSFKNKQDAFEISLMKKYIAPGDTVGRSELARGQKEQGNCGTSHGVAEKTPPIEAHFWRFPAAYCSTIREST